MERLQFPVEVATQQWHGYILPQGDEHEQEDWTHGLGLIRLDGHAQQCCVHLSGLKGPAGVLLSQQGEVEW